MQLLEGQPQLAHHAAHLEQLAGVGVRLLGAVRELQQDVDQVCEDQPVVQQWLTDLQRCRDSLQGAEEKRALDQGAEFLGCATVRGLLKGGEVVEEVGEETSVRRILHPQLVQLVEQHLEQVAQLIGLAEASEIAIAAQNSQLVLNKCYPNFILSNIFNDQSDFYRLVSRETKKVGAQLTVS